MTRSRKEEKTRGGEKRSLDWLRCAFLYLVFNLKMALKHKGARKVAQMPIRKYLSPWEISLSGRISFKPFCIPRSTATPKRALIS